MPTDVTTQDLIKAKNNRNGYTALHIAAEYGHYPADCTVEDLIITRDKAGFTALHAAAEHRNLPKNCTAADLAAVKNEDGLTALHIAAVLGILPPNTTVEQLTNTKNNNGWSVLHTAAYYINIPEWISLVDLTSVKDNKGISALNALILNNSAKDIREIIPSLLNRTTCTDMTLAKHIANEVKYFNPANTTLWLAKQINNQPQITK